MTPEHIWKKLFSGRLPENGKLFSRRLPEYFPKCGNVGKQKVIFCNSSFDCIHVREKYPLKHISCDRLAVKKTRFKLHQERITQAPVDGFSRFLRF